ncbi:MAG: hypothetical protein JWP81_2793 [Ferruginibacter sp.]|nr:hypothetical protein [Ferruginibacter sp.]
MKKIRTLAEALVLIGLLPLLVFAELNHTRYSFQQHEKAPLIKREYSVNEHTFQSLPDTNTGSTGPRLIVINL